MRGSGTRRSGGTRIRELNTVATDRTTDLQKSTVFPLELKLKVQGEGAGRGGGVQIGGNLTLATVFEGFVLRPFGHQLQ